LEARAELRTQWQAGLKPVILTAAMFRPDVKTAGVLQVIDSCRTLQQEGVDYLLVIVGDGSEKDVIRSAAQQRIPGHFIMTGRVPRHRLPNLFSAADLFAFPGVNEGLGMVYLEAQACGLPVVALRNWGASEAVIHMETGLLAPAENPDGFTDGIRVLAQHKALRETMGSAARRHIVRQHDMNRNYEAVEHILKAARASVPVRAR
jgi:glycosyltransferase involved in cell wall biosynthesis